MKNKDRREEIAFEIEHDASECEVSEAALAQPFPLGQVLREEAEAELSRRDGEWDAFTMAVFRRVDQAASSEERMSVEQRAIEMMKSEVEGELAEMAPRFEHDFKEGIEQRIWDAARARPSLGERISQWFDSLRASLVPRTIGLAAAGAAAIALVVLNLPPGPGTSIVDPIAVQPGNVSIDRVSFGGSVTLMNQDGITVVWLADGTTS